MSGVLNLPMAEFIKELELILPLKKKSESKDIVIFLEENMKKKVSAKFAQIVRIEPAPGGKNWWTVSFCFLAMPLVFKSIIINQDNLDGQELFSISGRLHYVRALDMDLLTDEHYGIQFPLVEGVQNREITVQDSPERKNGNPKLTLVKKEPGL
ncbi:MAG: hypothetical protein LBP22_00770 [Deltaproteobacteria bacterium]|jgi:hypothetical protein|nr:hypothetical protein [Deltaproteobacteria bacterium]